MEDQVTGFSCKILADSRHPNGNRLTTMEVRYPRIIHSELLTHKRSSRNSASSRAIPIAKMLADVDRDPFLPIHWGAAQSGMQAYDEVSPEVQEVAKQKILAHFQQALQLCRELTDLGLAKQVVNRYIEPWMWITVVVSGTTSSWANMFALRCHHMAEPHFQKIAKMARAAMKDSTPRLLAYGQWHLPYFGFLGDEDIAAEDAPKVSAARCARISYLTQAGIRDVAEDVKLYDRLVAQEPKHASALEHPAECMQLTGCGAGVSYEQAAKWSGNYEHGWRQLRKTVPNEACDVLDFE